MQIAADTVVELEYSLHLGDSIVVDGTQEGEPPFEYLHGYSEIVPGLEAALEGLVAGDKREIVLTPEKAYGEYDKENIEEVPLDFFEGEEIEVGDEFMAFDEEDEEGEERPAKILKIDGDVVTVDFNHPLAGKTLHFSVTVKNVRAATAEELEHGHAHGPEGHEHD